MHFSKVTPQSRFYPDAVVHLAFLCTGIRAKPVRPSNCSKRPWQTPPDNADFRYYLGTFYEELEAYEKAVQMLEEAIGMDPDETKYLFRLGVVYDKWGRKDDSVETMKAVVRIDPQARQRPQLSRLHLRGSPGEPGRGPTPDPKEALTIKPDEW
ncbi:MAG: tetratricopeptide repeat protein [Deltaproteobacteria bacterium]|nr:tetratricopeptide repeat protein [Deltaproteobacteria bacterium]